MSSTPSPTPSISPSLLTVLGQEFANYDFGDDLVSSLSGWAREGDEYWLRIQIVDTDESRTESTFVVEVKRGTETVVDRWLRG